MVFSGTAKMARQAIELLIPLFMYMQKKIQKENVAFKLF